MLLASARVRRGTSANLTIKKGPSAAVAVSPCSRLGPLLKHFGALGRRKRARPERAQSSAESWRPKLPRGGKGVAAPRRGRGTSLFKEAPVSLTCFLANPQHWDRGPCGSFVFSPLRTLDSLLLGAQGFFVRPQGFWAALRCRAASWPMADGHDAFPRPSKEFSSTRNVLLTARFFTNFSCGPF